MSIWVALEIIGALALVAVVVVLLISRRSRIRSWRFGLFYESEDRYPNGHDDDDP